MTLGLFVSPDIPGSARRRGEGVLGGLPAVPSTRPPGSRLYRNANGECDRSPFV